jgi:hypothetical protein
MQRPGYDGMERPCHESEKLVFFGVNPFDLHISVKRIAGVAQ